MLVCFSNEKCATLTQERKQSWTEFFFIKLTLIFPCFQVKKFADDYAYDVLTDDTDDYKPKDKDVKDLDSEDKDLDFELGEVNFLEKNRK